MPRKFKKVRTRKDVLSDPRFDELEYGGWTEEWGKDIWIYLKSGFNCEGCSCVHEATWGDVCDKMNYFVVEGEPY